MKAKFINESYDYGAENLDDQLRRARNERDSEDWGYKSKPANEPVQNEFDFLDVVDWLEYIYDWTYVEHEGQNRIRYDWNNDQYSMWINDDGSIEGKIPSEIKKELLSKGVSINESYADDAFKGERINDYINRKRSELSALRNATNNNPTFSINDDQLSELIERVVGKITGILDKEGKSTKSLSLSNSVADTIRSYFKSI